MIKKPVTIRNSMDMETRPIAHLVQEASQYKSQVYIEMDDKKINAKSIMGIFQKERRLLLQQTERMNPRQ